MWLNIFQDQILRHHESPNFHTVETSDKNTVYTSQLGNIEVIFPMVRRLTEISIRTEVTQIQDALEFGRQSDWECCARPVHNWSYL